jgi:CubicO group peptidase (beta-lactamase class C family)
MAASGRFSGTVLLAYAGRPVLTRAFAWADKDRNIQTQTGALFNLGSVTKTFTGVAVAQLAAQGKFDFQATLGSFLGGFSAQVANVTIH